VGISSIAIIGLGSIGRRHLRLTRELFPDIKIFVVRSGIGENHPELIFANKVFYSIDDLLKDGVDAAIISSPTSLHISQATKLASRGVHLLIEKPLSINSHGLKEFYNLINSSKLVIAVGYVLRFHPILQFLKNTLEKDNFSFGKILSVDINCASYLPDWRPNYDYKKSVSALKDLGGGVLLELSHEIDYAIWLFGLPHGVFAKVNNSGSLGIEVDDQADIIFNNLNYNCAFHLDFNSRLTNRNIKIRSTNGEVNVDLVKSSFSWMPSFGDNYKKTIEVERDQIYISQILNFIDSISKSKPIVPLNDAISVMRVIDKINESNRLKKEVEV